MHNRILNFHFLMMNSKQKPIKNLINGRIMEQDHILFMQKPIMMQGSIMKVKKSALLDSFI